MVDCNIASSPLSPAASGHVEATAETVEIAEKHFVDVFSAIFASSAVFSER